MLKVFISAIRLYLIKEARLRVLLLHRWHLDAAILNVCPLDRLEELTVFDLLNRESFLAGWLDQTRYQVLGRL